MDCHARREIQSTADFRYELTLNCLASVAADPDRLPSFGVLSDGVARVQDAAGLSASTLWTRVLGFSSQTLGLNASTAPQEQWTIDPIADYTQLEAMRAACRWVLYGPDRAEGQSEGILNSPIEDPRTGLPHFGVAERLAQLPPGWLHVGRLIDVPHEACYKAHCGCVWVWVMPDGMQALSEFTLVLHDIATIDINAGATNTPPILVQLEMRQLVPKPASAKAPSEKRPALGSEDWWRENLNSNEVVFSVVREIKLEHRDEIEQWLATRKGNISWKQWMEWTKPYHGPRVTITPTGTIHEQAAASGLQAPSPIPGRQPPFRIGLDATAPLAPAPYRLQPPP
jgi:hypothetical protein